MEVTLTRGCVSAQRLLQQIIVLPIQVCAAEMELKVVKSFVDSKSHARLVWKLTKHFVTFLTITALFHISTIFKHWKEGNNAEQICIYTIIFCLTRIGIVAFDTLEASRFEFASSITQTYRLSKFAKTGGKRKVLNKLIEIFIVQVSATSLIVTTFMFAGIPWFVDYHPIYLIIKWIWGLHALNSSFALILRIASIIVYAGVAMQGGGVVVYLLLITVSFTEAMFKASFNMLEVKQQTVHFIAFSRNLKLYRCVQILINYGSQIVADFLQTLLMMGILLAACSGYTFIKLANAIPLTLYLLVSFFFPLCISVDLLLFAFAAAPAENAIKFKRMWGVKLVRKMDRLQLRSCPGISYAFGFIRNCQKKTALAVIDVEVNSAASLSLIRIT